MKVHKMLGHLFILLFLISPSQSCGKDGDNNLEDPEAIYVPNGEPYFIRCIPNPPLSPESYNITWFKNGSQTEISTDRQARVHQDNNYLKFLPTRQEDSDLYLCNLWTAEGCEQKAVRVFVFENDNGLCYINEALYVFMKVLQSSLPIECPAVADIVDTTTAQFRWFKDCKPLDLTTDIQKYFPKKNTLTIDNFTLQDNGIYTCVTSYILNGTNYNISRSINLTIQALPQENNPRILYPTNNYIDAELGTSVTVTCEAKFSKDSLFWLYQEQSFISEYSEDGRVIEGLTYDEVAEDGQKISYKNVTFSQVKEEDYGKKFYCEAETVPLYSSAFFVLKKPDPNLQGFLIAFFVTGVFLIIISIIIIKVFKVDLVLWYRSSRFSHQHQNDGKTYDAYIMYPRNGVGSSAYDMDLFVLKLLPEVLEKQCAYQLFIIGRDDLPGQAMADVVDQAISQSRRVIIVLGHVSNESNLGEDFEQKIAMYDALIRNQLKVILIEMEKITDFTFLPESIKYIRQKQGVLRWKETFTEDSLSPNTRFWKNVRYQMPPAPRHSGKDLHYTSTVEL